MDNTDKSKLEKDFEVETPVLLFVFIRPETIKHVFDSIRVAKPKTLFLVSDGPRNSIDKKLIDSSREIVENIDWKCDVHKLFFEENNGMYNTFRLALDFVFSKVDRCIFLEDDVVPSNSFYKFCDELLTKYEHDLRINSICGMNHFGITNDIKEDYFFLKTGSIWGFALWKRTYDLFYKFDYSEDENTLDNLVILSSKYRKLSKSIENYPTNNIFNGHEPGPEFYMGLNLHSQNQLNIVPKKNMIKNIGYGLNNTHFYQKLNQLPKAVQKMFNMETYEYDFPLKHPTYVFNNIKYEKQLYKLIGRDKLTYIKRKIEIFIRLIFSFDFKTIKKKMKRK